MKKFLLLIVCILIPFLSVNTASAAKYADIAFVIDQSGSMDSEFNWLGNSIAAISAEISGAGITANYGLAGYEYLAGDENNNNDNVFIDISSSITAITNAIPTVKTYGGTERGYHAADWATTGFNWTGGNYAKVIILITDEDADQGSGITESALGAAMTNGGFLLNVIAPSGYSSQWDDAVYKNGSYSGFFDLDYLRTNAAAFTATFAAAKLAEIQNFPDTPVPEPATMLLFSIGLIGLAGVSRRKK